MGLLDGLLGQVIGGAVGGLAASLGVNQFTPQGQLPQGHGDLLSQRLEILKGVGHR